MTTAHHHHTTPAPVTGTKQGNPTRLTFPQPTGLIDTPGANCWDADLERCQRCDSRYCHTACMAGDPDHFYVTGRGWLNRTAAAQQALRWTKQGLDWGPHHPVRRIEMVCQDRACRRCHEPFAPTVELSDLIAHLST